MGRTILFSPVGGTDPISEFNCYDGAMLHICRHQHPDKAYLFMSNEIMNLHHKDNRYLRSLELLEKKNGHHIETAVIEKPDLIDAHIFEEVYPILQDEVMKVMADLEEDDELLLNMSSGTPAMKSAMIVLAVMLDIPCKCIQVGTPERKMNTHVHSKDYDLETLWELNPDNTDSEETFRDEVQSLPTLLKWKYEAAITEYVKGYNYRAALVLAEMNKKRGNETPYLIPLRIATAREYCNFDSVDKWVSKLPSAEEQVIYRPFEDPMTRRIYEFMQELRARVKKKDFRPFLMEISPVLGDLLSSILYAQTGIDVTAFTTTDNWGNVYWDKDALRQKPEMLEAFNSYKKGYSLSGYVRNNDYAVLIFGLVKDQQIVQCVKDLIALESRCRNVAAHQLVTITPRFIMEKTGYDPDEIMCLLEEAFTYSEFDFTPEDWNSYERMNQEILKTLGAF